MSLETVNTADAIPEAGGRRWTLWGAILAGAVVTITLHETLDLLGAGIGLGLIPHAGDAGSGVRSLAIGGAIWWLVVTIAAVGAGGFVTGHLMQTRRRDHAALHGLATWGISSLVWMVAMTTLMGGMFAGMFGIASQAAEGAAGPAMSSMLSGGGSGGLGRESSQLRLRGREGDERPAGMTERGGTAGGGTESLGAMDLRQRMRDWVTASDDDAARASRRQELARTISERTTLSERDADAMLGRLDAEKKEAAEAAKTASKVASAAAIWGFLGLLLSAGAGMFGATMGNRCAWSQDRKNLARTTAP